VAELLRNPEQEKLKKTLERKYSYLYSEEIRGFSLSVAGVGFIGLRRD
jgi:hypothetical protein